MISRGGTGKGYDNFLKGMFAGAGLMYLLDPDRGRRRRAILRDQGVHLSHRASHAKDTTSRDVRNRTVGVIAGTASRLRRDRASAEVVEARVRSKLGRLVSHPGAIDVWVMDGVATLRGDVLASELRELLKGVGGVKGVRRVQNDLRVHDRAGDVPALQGESRKPQNRPELLQENWAPATRLVAGGMGGMLAIAGLRRRGLVGAAMRYSGLTLLARAVTNLEIRRLTGIDADRRAVDLRKAITVNAPVRDVFDFWSDFENLPSFMSHLKEVRNTGAGRSHWVAEGPAGIRVAWDAELTAFEAGETIAWRSIGATPVGNAGIVRFQSAGENATRIDVRMSYNPPAGAIGHAIAALFGADPKRAMDEDLVRLKSLLEDGRTTADGVTVTREEHENRLPVETGSD